MSTQHEAHHPQLQYQQYKSRDLLYFSLHLLKLQYFWVFFFIKNAKTSYFLAILYFCFYFKEQKTKPIVCLSSFFPFPSHFSLFSQDETFQICKFFFPLLVFSFWIHLWSYKLLVYWFHICEFSRTVSVLDHIICSILVDWCT